jgi:A/G-specific adenine glycosylase
MAKPNRQSAVGSRQLKRLVPSLLDWFATNARDLPWRHTCDPYAIWVSEIMLQQTQVKTVVPFWERWMRELPTIEAVAEASPASIHKLWEGLGYYNRVRNLQKAARIIVAQHGGKFPDAFDDVLALPGIGRYTAGAICSIAFNQPTPILDGNVIRVLTRVFGFAKNPKERKTNARLWKLAEELVAHAPRLHSFRGDRRKEAHSETGNSQSLPTPAATITGNCSALNQSLMELGALVCTPRNTQCRICPVKKLCVAFGEHRVEELPNLGKRPAATARRFAAFVVKNNGRFLVRQRPAGVVNGLLWEFPNAEISGGKSSPKLAARNIFGATPVQIEAFSTVRHSITRYRISLEAFVVSLRKLPRKTGGAWKTPPQIEKLAFTAAHRKILQAVLRHGPLPGSAGRK